jgi:hypothetical protein
MEETMEMQSLHAESPIQEQEPSTSVRKKVAITIVILAVCGLGLWIGIEMALNATSGHS